MGARVSTQSVPSELVIQMSSHLRHEDLLAISLLNRHFNRLVASSATLQHRILLEEGGLLDYALACSHSVPLMKKVDSLKRRQSLWAKCLFLSSRSSAVAWSPVLNTSIHCYARSLAQGLIVAHRRWSVAGVADDSHRLHVFAMESKSAMGPTDSEGVTAPENAGVEVKPSKIFNDTPLREVFTIDCYATIVGFAVDRYMHDLISLCTVSGQDSEQATHEYTINVHLRHSSNAAPHVHAAQPVIPIVRSSVPIGDEWIFEKMDASMEIVGRNILILLNWSIGLDFLPTAYNRLILVDWISGDVVAHDVTKNGAWSSFTFLSGSHFILANQHTETLDIIRLPERSHKSAIDNATEAEGVHPTFTRLLSLHLPERSSPIGFSLKKLEISSKPCPFKKDSESQGTYHVPMLFSTSPEKAIVQVNMSVTDSNTGESIRCGFVVHRSALLDLLQQHSVAVENIQPDYIHPYSPKRRRIGRESATSGPNVLKWESWGPNITHWFEQTIEFDRPQKVAFGQRIVWVDSEAGEFVVWDFNPNAVRRATNALAEEDGNEAFLTLRENGISMELSRKVIRIGGIRPGGFFKKPIFSCLPCVETRCDFASDTPAMPIHIDEEYLLMEEWERVGIERRYEFQGKFSVFALTASDESVAVDFADTDEICTPRDDPVK